MTMYLNISDFIANNTSSVNKSEVPGIDYYEEYKSTKKENIIIYKWVEYVIGIVIVLSNVVVVISSGLILKKGKQPKNTYLLLGNVSLADTIFGFTLIFSMTTDEPATANIICIFRSGMMTCPVLVSIFSVGLITVDRYIYILHGLYYQRWFNTRRVRIGILYIWIISVTLAFLPATGWTNRESINTRCYYTSLYPGALLLLNSSLGFITLIVVAVLYSFILVQALKTVDNIQSSMNIDSTKQTNQLRMYRKTLSDQTSAACSNQSPKNSVTSKINKKLKKTREAQRNEAQNCHDNEIYQEIESDYKSNVSVYTIELNYSGENSSMTDISRTTNDVESNINNRSATKRKSKEPNKWRAISIIMLTSGSFIITWLPFIIAVDFFVFCEDKSKNDRCMYIRTLIGGPLGTLAFVNSILNPLIYAWWHKGFQKFIKIYYRKCLQKICICTKSET